MTGTRLLWVILAALLPSATAHAQQNPDSGVNLTPYVVANAGPWQLGYLGCSHTSFNLDCRVTAINTSDSPKLIRFVWKSQTSKSRAPADQSAFSHVTDPQGKPYFFGHVWEFVDIHKKGTEDQGSAVFSADSNQRLYFQIIVYGVPTDIIEFRNLALITQVRDKKDSPGATHLVSFPNVPVIGLNEDPNSPKNSFFRSFPFVRRWAFTLYILVAWGAFFWHIGNKKFLVTTITSYILNTIFLSLLIYSSAYLMYWHPQSWQHGYEFSFLPETMSNGPLEAGEIPKGTTTYWGLLILAVSLVISFPQSVLNALGADPVLDSPVKRLFFWGARWLGVGVCFVALITTLSSIMNPYRSSKWFLMFICCVAIYFVNRAVVAKDLHMSIVNSVPGGAKSLDSLGRAVNWLRKIGFF